MVDRRSLREKISREISVVAEDPDRLLYDFLTELIIIKDVDSLLFKDFHVGIDDDDDDKKEERRLRLTCTMRGEPIDRVHHRLRNDVKAVTMHMFGITQK